MINANSVGNRENTLHSVGRRKSSVARVWLKPGKGDVEINGKKYLEYFDTEISRNKVIMPLKISGLTSAYDVFVNVCGGGLKGQADATRLGIARVLIKINESLKPLMRKYGFLTVDSRIKERKKYGRKAARRRFQFVKR
jgi:small subunit ribosomal protein S9